VFILDEQDPVSDTAAFIFKHGTSKQAQDHQETGPDRNRGDLGDPNHRWSLECRLCET
jgi:hypothetical protein